MTMRRLLSSLLLATFLGSSAAVYWMLKPAAAQNNQELFYTFFGKKIALTEQPDAIAVSFKKFRSRGKPLYLQLQDDLAGGSSTRGGRGAGSTSAANSEIEVKSLGEQYAIVKLASSELKTQVTQKIRQQQYVESTLPILSRPASASSAPSSIILPNEILVSFAPNLSEGEINTLLNQQKLEMVRKLRFTKNRYIVKSRDANGTAILNVTNQLNQVSGIQSATPNFIQSLPHDLQLQAHPARTDNPTESIPTLLATLPKLTNVPFPSNLLSLEWHLNSTPRRGNSLPRTDVRATEAWKQSHSGDRVVVAVIDSLIQWDHPDLAANIYTLPPGTPDAMPGETHGWDFVKNSPDTRIGDEEMAELQPAFRNSFELTTAEILKTYPREAEAIASKRPKWSPDEIARCIRNYIQSEVTGKFHGTWTSGVIAARPSTADGVAGVAPKATILPIRGVGLEGTITPETEIETIAYAAARKADVINMSFGGSLPSQDVANEIFSVLDEHPNLVMVASAGNEDVDGVSFPAAVPGVLSVGATNLDGLRAPYSSYGQRLDVVAPGGDTSKASSRGILTTGGTWMPNWWQGVTQPPAKGNWGWGTVLDPRGRYVQVQGTSFSAPVTSGVVALMKSEDPEHHLNRDRLLSIIKKTSSYNGLTISKADANRYRLQAGTGVNNPQLQIPRPSGVYHPAPIVSAQQYYFGSGLINAEAAVQAVKEQH